MTILGNRVLVSKVEEEKKGDFEIAQVQDNFVNKGKIVQMGDVEKYHTLLSIGSVILFAKYSPDTQEIEHEGQKMKIVSVNDILAIL